MYIDCWLYSKTCLKWPLKKEDQLSLNACQKYWRMLQREHSAASAILSTFINLPFVNKIFILSFFEWLLKTCFTVLTTYMYFLFCEVRRLGLKWILLLKFTTKGWVHWAHCLGKWWAIFWNYGTMTQAHHKSEGLCVLSMALARHYLHPLFSVLLMISLVPLVSPLTWFLTPLTSRRQAMQHPPVKHKNSASYYNKLNPFILNRVSHQSISVLRVVGWCFFHLHSNFNRTFWEQTVETLILVCTVCLCPTKWVLGLYG